MTVEPWRQPDWRCAAGTAHWSASRPSTNGCVSPTQQSWGQEWAATARESRDEFAAAFLRFTEPFADRTEFASRLEENFDTVEVLLRSDTDEYQAGTDHGV